MKTIDTAKLAGVTGGVAQPPPKPVLPPEPSPTFPPPVPVEGAHVGVPPAVTRSSGWSWFWGNRSGDQN